MDRMFHAHVKAFLLAQQVGEDPKKNLARIRVIANSSPAGWDGKLPVEGIRPDEGFCKVVEASADRPVAPWWWYAAEREPVPAVVSDIAKRLSFDFAMVYQKAKAWVYIAVEPSAAIMKLMSRQDHLRAFILMSLINKSIPREQRENKRLRLATLMESKDIEKIFTFVAFRQVDPASAGIPEGLPVLSRLVHPSSKTANWSIRLPGDKHSYGSCREIIPGL